MVSILGNDSSDGGNTLSKLSPFAIHKGVKAIAGDEVTIKRLFNVDIYRTCSEKNPYQIIY